MKKQTSSKSPQKPRPAGKPRKLAYARVVEFPQAKGRTVELVELIAATDYHCLSIRFKDKTDLSVVIDSMFTFRVNFSDWKTDNQRLIKEMADRTGLKAQALLLSVLRHGCVQKVCSAPIPAMTCDVGNSPCSSASSAVKVLIFRSVLISGEIYAILAIPAIARSAFIREISGKTFLLRPPLLRVPLCPLW